MASTTGLIQGIDLSNIRATIFLGMPYGLLNLYQKSGHGGRDGRRSWSVLLCQSNSHLMLAKLWVEDDIACQREGDEWASYIGCCRVGFSWLLDGQDMSCAQLHNSHFCDQCDPSSQLMRKIEPFIDPPHAINPPRDPGQDFDLFDSFALDLMAIDVSELDQILALTQLSLPSAMPHSRPLHHLLPPIVTNPSITILRDASYYHQTLNTKKKKTTVLHTLVNMLFNKCVIC